MWVTTVDLFPHTGRKHQLRRHMALMLHPILGDPKHGFGYRAQRHQSGQSLAADSHCVLQEAAVEAGPWVFRILRGVVRGIGHLGD